MRKNCLLPSALCSACNDAIFNYFIELIFLIYALRDAIFNSKNGVHLVIEDVKSNEARDIPWLCWLFLVDKHAITNFHSYELKGLRKISRFLSFHIR